MEEENKNDYVFVVLSQTPSGFGKAIRRVAGLNYNHASIAFDENLNELYSFGRIKNRVPILAGFVKEYPERFSLGQAQCVNIIIYKIPVTKQQLEQGKCTVREIASEKDAYMYNLLSVVTFPLLHGFSTYKAFSCSEFVAHVLQHMNVLTNKEKKASKYTPEDLMHEVIGEVHYQGNMLTYCNASSEESNIFFEKPEYVRDTVKSIHYIMRLINRKVRFI